MKNESSILHGAQFDPDKVYTIPQVKSGCIPQAGKILLMSLALWALIWIAYGVIKQIFNT